MSTPVACSSEPRHGVACGTVPNAACQVRELSDNPILNAF